MVSQFLVSLSDQIFELLLGYFCMLHAGSKEAYLVCRSFRVALTSTYQMDRGDKATR